MMETQDHHIIVRSYAANKPYVRGHFLPERTVPYHPSYGKSAAGGKW